MNAVTPGELNDRASADRIVLDAEFDTLSEFEECLSLYSDKVRQVFVKRDGHTLKNKPPVGAPANQECVYLDFKLVCMYGEKRHKPSSSGARKTKTIKNGCMSNIIVKLTIDNQRLKITSLSLNHNGHDGSEAFYDLLPKNRKLKTAEEINEVKKLFLAGCSVIGIQNVLIEQGKSVLPKDLQNFRQRNIKGPEDDSLETLFHLLRETYKADVDVVYENEDGMQQVKVIYFSTEKMRSDFKSWPEIVFADGTHKLVKRGYITILLCVQDSLGLSHIVAVARIANEQMNTLEAVFTICKNKNPEAAERIKCFMTDKDLTERAVIKNVFPNAVLYICEFHILKIFSRTITINGMKITSAQRDEALNLLNKLVKSDSEKKYNYWYERFSAIVPPSVLEYFNNNWEVNRMEWVRYSMAVENLGNYTNNPVESTNARLKDGISPNSTMKDFVNGFFKYIARREIAIKAKVHDDTYKLPINGYMPGSPEYEFQKILTENAFQLVNQQLRRREPMDFLHIDDSNRACWIQSGFRVVSADVSSCECLSYTEKKLPCRHIFAVRAYFGVSLYEPDLFPQRYTKVFNFAHQTNSEFTPFSQNSLELQVPSSLIQIHQMVTPKPKNKQQRYKAIKEVTDKIADIGAMSSGHDFEKKMEFLKVMLETWRKNEDIATVIDSVAGLTVSDVADNNPVQVDTLTAATPLKVKGRSKGNFSCTAPRRKAKK